MSPRPLLQRQILCLITALWLAGTAAASAKATGFQPFAAAPGELHLGGEGARIFLEAGRTLLWPNQGLLVLEGPDGAVLAKIDLQAKAVRKNGAEAMGLNLEEADLGGSLSSKKYLKGKKSPVGRSLGSGELGGVPASGEAGQTNRSVVQGIPISIVSYPNGSSFWKLEWPNFTEE